MGAAGSAGFDPVILPGRPSGADGNPHPTAAAAAVATAANVDTARLAVDAIRFGDDGVLGSLAAEHGGLLARVRDRGTGATLLHYAAAAGAASAVRVLVGGGTAGAAPPMNVNARDTAGRTPLMYAAGTPGASDTLMAALLAEGGDVMLVDGAGNNALHVAVTAGAPAALRALLRDAPEAASRAKNAAGCTPAELARSAGGEMAAAFDTATWMTAQRAGGSAVRYRVGGDEVAGTRDGDGRGGDAAGHTYCGGVSDVPAALGRATTLAGRGKLEAAIDVLNDVVALAASAPARDGGSDDTSGDDDAARGDGGRAAVRCARWHADALLQRAAVLEQLKQGEAAAADYTAAMGALHLDARWVTALSGRARATLASVAAGPGPGGTAATREEVNRLAHAAGDVEFACQLAASLSPGAAPAPVAAELATLRRRARAALRAADPAAAAAARARGGAGDEARDYYEVLLLEPGADDAAIRAAYRGLARQLHPDKFAFAAPAARARVTADFQRITRAAAVLTDPTRKALYDAALARMRHGAGDGAAAEDDDDTLLALHHALDAMAP